MMDTKSLMSLCFKGWSEIFQRVEQRVQTTGDQQRCWPTKSAESQTLPWSSSHRAEAQIKHYSQLINCEGKHEQSPKYFLKQRGQHLTRVSAATSSEWGLVGLASPGSTASQDMSSFPFLKWASIILRKKLNFAPSHALKLVFDQQPSPCTILNIS